MRMAICMGWNKIVRNSLRIFHLYWIESIGFLGYPKIGKNNSVEIFQCPKWKANEVLQIVFILQLVWVNERKFIDYEMCGMAGLVLVFIFYSFCTHT